MRKNEFIEKVQNVLMNPPQRTVQTEISFAFGFFKRKEYSSISLSKDIIKDYASFIVDNYKGFSEPSKFPIYYKTADESAYRCKSEVSHLTEDKNTLYSLNEPSESGIQAVIDKAKNEETFSDMLIRLQREKGLKAPTLYHAAGIDYKHFSKIISDRSYRPSKSTVFAFAIALKLDLKTTETLLSKAGHAINPSDMFDMTIKYFIQSGFYDREKIDMLMESFELQLLPQNW